MNADSARPEIGAGRPKSSSLTADLRHQLKAIETAGQRRGVVLTARGAMVADEDGALGAALLLRRPGAPPKREEPGA
jgi:hypothetical protein